MNLLFYPFSIKKYEANISLRPLENNVQNTFFNTTKRLTFMLLISKGDKDSMFLFTSFDIYILLDNEQAFSLVLAG